MHKYSVLRIQWLFIFKIRWHRFTSYQLRYVTVLNHLSFLDHAINLVKMVTSRWLVYLGLCLDSATMRIRLCLTVYHEPFGADGSCTPGGTPGSALYALTALKLTVYVSPLYM